MGDQEKPLSSGRGAITLQIPVASRNRVAYKVKARGGEHTRGHEAAWTSDHRSGAHLPAASPRYSTFMPHSCSRHRSAGPTT